MFNLYKIVVGLLLLLAFALAQISGSNSLVHVQSASTMKEKRLDFRTDVQFFTKVGDFLGQTKPANFSAVNFLRHRPKF